MHRTYDVANPEQMTKLGRALGGRLFPGCVIGLVGPLGAGKTFFTRALAEGLGVADSRIVNSPTFVLIQEYPAQLPIYHFDTYRLPHSRSFADLGIDEYFAAGGVCVIEWADRVTDVLPAERLMIRIEPTGTESRRVVLEAHGAAYAELLRDGFALSGS